MNEVGETVRVLIPELIAEEIERGNERGELDAASLFVDLSGFTEMTGALMKHGKRGAEMLSQIINAVFDPLTGAVYEAGGLITTFAGDAFTALFPGSSADAALAAASRIRRAVDKQHLQHTPFGEFPIEARIGVGYGAAGWGIIRAESGATFWIRGEALDRAAAAEHHAEPGGVVLDDAARQSLQKDYSLKPLARSYFAVVTPERLNGAADLNPRWQSEVTAETQSLFEPLHLLPQSGAGEFRDLNAAFLSFAQESEVETAVRFVRDRAEEHGGYCDLLDFGDKGPIMLVLFGAPRSHGHDSRRAAQFAESVVRELGAEVRIGLAAGTAFAGYVGGGRRATYTALGSVINLAARIAMSAIWGVAEANKQLAQRVGHAHSAGKRRLKGFEQAVELYRITEPSAGSSDASQRSLPLVGRSQSSAALEKWLSRLQAGESSGLLAISGEAGVGKSHLLRHVLPRFAQSINVIELQADAILRKSLNPVPRIVLHAFDFFGIEPPGVDSEQPEQAIRALVNELRRQGGHEAALEGLQRSEWALLALLGIYRAGSAYDQLDPQARFETTQNAISVLMRTFSAHVPTVLVVEDAHSLDSDSSTLLARLCRELDEEPFGLLLVYRSEASPKLPVDVEERTGTEHIALEPLASEAPEELLTVTLGAPVSAALVGFVSQRVGTNPLYLTELARFLHAKQYLHHGAQGLTIDEESVPVPREIQSLLVQRIDTLPESVRSAAQSAAVIGSEFSSGILQRILPNIDVPDALARGEDEGLWRATGEGHYRFTQELVREAVVDMQFEGQLKQLHARIAEALEAEFGDDRSRAPDLAHHYRMAEDAARARRYLWRAFEYSRDNFKNDKALEFLSDYLTYAEDFSGREEAYRQMAAIHEVTGDWDRAADKLTYALGLTVIADKMTARAQLLSALGNVYQRRGRNAEAISTLQSALRIARRLDNPELAAESLVSMGRSYWSSGEYARAQRRLQEARKEASRAGNRRQEGLALYFEGVVLRDQNEFESAMRHYRAALKRFRELGDERLGTYPLYDMAVVLQYAGKLERSKRYFERALAVYRKIGYQSGASAVLLNLGVLRDRRGDFDGAIEYFQQARDIAEAIDEKLAIAYTLFSIGATYYKLRDLRKSHEYLKDSLRLMQRLRAKGYYGFALSFLVSLYARTGNPEKAITVCHRHVRNVQQTGSDVENGRAYLGLALALEHAKALSDDAREKLDCIGRFAAVGDTDAEAFFQKAISVAEAANYVNTSIPAHYQYARFLERRRRGAEFREHLERAYTLAREAQWDRFVGNVAEAYPQLTAELAGESTAASQSAMR